MANNKFFLSYLPIFQAKGIQKLFTTAILVFAVGSPSLSVQAAQLNENHFNNGSGQQSSEPEINTVGEQPLVVAQRYNRRPRVRRTIIIGPRRRYRVRPIRRSRVQRVYRPVRRYRVQPVRRYNNRYRGQRVYIR
ncbi:MAG: hypothetical protein KME49_30140 [Brasilonema octagenarum HA4186-MV1]|jgi:hypothetical protein|uniref:Uncharacterized protein n=1 Tax=Brasilonema sennae CENA114 TaxID=415709 RepID=A0A856MHD0_9CYAN|nr:hypothetical protein [Brasilonema sennae]MBW4629656.1 hypothetical protein [Brasilonema octagenarum HA4186-MV1]QDL09639.1 hypothetical protein DP114_18620 [Brasilonema sennae CENA114]QDL15994.1 hypothetical protein DP113_18550 [Brasilonema octagenarum UFV-E1]